MTDDDQVKNLVESPTLSNYLAIAEERRRHFHESLWEVEKHYTWWIYIVFGALIAIYINRHAVGSWWPWLISLTSLFGMFISIAGFRAIRKEGEYFKEAQQISDRILIKLGIAKMKVDGELLVYDNKVQPLKTVREKANRSIGNLVRGLFHGDLGVRDIFQLTFLIASLAFFLISVISLLFGLQTFARFVSASATCSRHRP